MGPLSPPEPRDTVFLPRFGRHPTSTYENTTSFTWHVSDEWQKPETWKTSLKPGSPTPKLCRSSLLPPFPTPLHCTCPAVPSVLQILGRGA